MEVFCLTPHFLLLCFWVVFYWACFFFFLIVLSRGNFFVQVKQQLSCAPCIKIFRILLNFRKCVAFIVLRKNLLNELTCIQFHNYVHGEIAYKLDDFPLGSFCEGSLENRLFLLLLYIFIIHFYASLPTISIIKKQLCNF